MVKISDNIPFGLVIGAALVEATEGRPVDRAGLHRHLHYQIAHRRDGPAAPRHVG